MALRGRPLTVELRAVPEVLKPASDVSESSALRLVKGRLVICCPVRLVAIAGDCVWTMLDDSPTTVMVSARVPICIVILTAVGMPAATLTESSSVVRNPCSSAVTEYLPPGMFGAVNPPSPPVTRVVTCPVPRFLTVMLTPGMAAPPESTTVPESCEKKLPWANAGALTLVATRVARATIPNQVLEPLMRSSCKGQCKRQPNVTKCNDGYDIRQH